MVKTSFYSNIINAYSGKQFNEMNQAPILHVLVPTQLLKCCFEILAPVIQVRLTSLFILELCLAHGKMSLFFLFLNMVEKELIMESYCPISNLTFVSKICDKVVAMQLTNHLLKNNLTDPF